MPPLILLPQPQLLTQSDGLYPFLQSSAISINTPALRFSAQRLQKAMADYGLHREILLNTAASSDTGVAVVSRGSRGERYTMTINAQGVLIEGESPAACFYAICTLIQIISQSGLLIPHLHIEDYPDFARRGVMLDISRDKVPSMETLYALVDRLASWKINEFQLYTEHTFAYRKHRSVWRYASPMTGEQIMALDAYCRERFIDLVPNQNSFGHWHRWLKHPEYRHLAESPDGIDLHIMLERAPFSLSPVVPESLQLLDELYRELLPHFSSQYFNVGCDETFDLGKGRSKRLCEEQGVGRVYLDFLTQVSKLVEKQGRTMQFWGDIILQHPELVSALPKNAVALEWGYEADHTFDADGAQFAAAGIPFYVCPGTSSWLTLVGRTHNMTGNLENAAEQGIKHGAIGYLITDWGDLGHWQPLPVSYAGYAYGAALSWAYRANKDASLDAKLSKFAFDDPTSLMGDLALALGDVYRLVQRAPHKNGVAMVRALLEPLPKFRERMSSWREQIKVEEILAATARMSELALRLEAAQPSDALILAEYRTSIGLWLHGCKRLIKAVDDTAYTSANLLAELRPLVGEFSANWIARNRVGGLGDSLTRMARLIAEYEASRT